MNYSSEAADQIMRISLNGVEVAARLSGKATERLAVLLYAILKDQHKSKGKIRLQSMLKSGKELKVFAVQDKDLRQFCTEAKKYGVLYCVLKDRDANDGLTDLMVRAEDASKINRIFERFQFSSIDMTTVQTDVPATEAPAIDPKTVLELAGKDPIDAYITAIAQEKPRDKTDKNPTTARTKRLDPSERFSKDRAVSSASMSSKSADKKRPSVRAQLLDIRTEQQLKTATHLQPQSKKKRRRAVTHASR